MRINEIQNGWGSDVIKVKEVLYSGPTAGYGLKANGSEGDIAFEDSYSSVKPWALQGAAGVIGASVRVGTGGRGIGRVVLGRAYQRPVAAGEERVLDLGMGLSIGSSTLIDYSINRCSCNE